MTIIDLISSDTTDPTTVDDYATTYRDAGVDTDNIYERDALPTYDTFRYAIDRRDVMYAGPHLQCWALIDDGVDRAWHPIIAA